jgi:hypothetical protein
VLVIAVFHASFDATISDLSNELIPDSDAVRFIIVNAVIVLGGVAVIVTARGHFANRRNDVRPVTTTA